MGKFNRHFKGNNRSDDRNKRKEREKEWKSTRGDENQRNNEIITTNDRMEAFYKAQGFVDESEWDQFIDTLRLPLPACFRINSDSNVFSSGLQAQLLTYVGEQIESEGKLINPVKQLSWYPNGMAYQLGTDRKSIRKLEVLKDLHRWMIEHTDNGNITRQEAVSMVPPLALDVAPHHKCLDMCAAPGSKTSQLLEIINQSVGGPAEEQGLVVANDSSTDRAYMLVHQCKRINSPLLVVTTHKGQSFPKLSPVKHALQVVNTSRSHNDGYFDRVLCDVPCSGDGTLRKNPVIWGKWRIASALTLHPLQLLIAQRGLQLLKINGLLVYSTCSMSPFENEAVVAELLRRSQGKLELVDARQFLPLFRARAGLSTWLVFDDYLSTRRLGKRTRDENGSSAAAGGDITASITTAATSTSASNDATELCDAVNVETDVLTGIEKIDRCVKLGMQHFPSLEAVPENLRKKFPRSVFPPSAEEVEWMHLERCLRCVPHDEDSGGFFVATLRKRAFKEGSDEMKVSSEHSQVNNDAANIETDHTTEMVDQSILTENDQPDEAKNDGDIEEADAHDDDNDNDDIGDIDAIGDDEEDTYHKTHHSKPVMTAKGLVDFKAWDEDAFLKVKEFYGLTDAISVDSFFVREDYCNTKESGVSAKFVYFMPQPARDLMAADKDGQVKIVCAGIKVLEKKVNKGNGFVEYRLIQEGVGVLLPFIIKRKLSVTIQVNKNNFANF